MKATRRKGKDGKPDTYGIVGMTAKQAGLLFHVMGSFTGDEDKSPSYKTSIEFWDAMQLAEHAKVWPYTVWADYNFVVSINQACHFKDFS